MSCLRGSSFFIDFTCRCEPAREPSSNKLSSEEWNLGVLDLLSMQKWRKELDIAQNVTRPSI
jgi:hypothetical protein